MSSEKINTSVIGAGFSGLSAACVLAKNGHKVTVFEKNDTPGGRASQLKENGFTFDLGPSWYWLPDVFEDFFAYFGKKPSDYYDLVRLNPSYRIFYSKDEVVDVPSGAENVMDLFESFEKGARQKLRKILTEAEFKYNIGVKNLVHKPAYSAFEFINHEVIQGIFKLDVFKSYHKYIRSMFKNPKLYPILEFPIIFLGATPKKTPALYSLMNYADIQLGTWYPKGGMFSVIEGFAKLAEELGVEIKCDSSVEKIVTKGALSKGVMVNGEFYESDYIVGSADYHYIEQNLLPVSNRRYNEDYWDKREMAPSSLLFYIGLDKQIKSLLHHNLFFDEDFQIHANEIFENPKWPTKPLLYVSCTSKSDDKVAPEGHENLVVLIPVAPGLEDTGEIREKYYNLVIERIEALTGESIRENIVYKKSFAHRDFQSRYNAYKGNAYGLGNTLMQTAFLKPKMNQSKTKNLFYAGQLTTPGPGVPPSIISGMVAAKEIVKKSKSLRYEKAV